MKGLPHITKLHLPLLLGLILFFSILSPCSAVLGEDGKTERVLRVAFPELEGFSETDQYGQHHGLVPDYLNEIAKYTGWKYEYISTDGESMIDGFLDGQYDLMGGTYYQPEFEKYFAYPDYNMGYSKSVLLTRRDNEAIKPYDIKSLAGKSIGVYENATENVRRLKEYLAINGIESTLVYYTSDQLVNGNLFPYLEAGDVDLLLGNTSDVSDTRRIAASFDSQPYYIVTQPDSPDILAGLNMALKKIVDSNPNFASERFNANFKDSKIASIFINDAERTYISQKGSVSVAVVSKWHPFYCINSDNGLHDGLIPDILKEIQDFTSLNFTYKYADSYKNAQEMVLSGEADLLGVFLGSEEDSIQMGLALTAPYSSLNNIVIRNKSVSFPDTGLVGGILEGRSMPPELEAARVIYFPNMEKALNAVNREKIDFFYGLSTRMEQLMQEHHYPNLVPVMQNVNNNDVCFAVRRPADSELLTIMNKALTSISPEKKEMLTNQNVMSTGIVSTSLTEFIYANPVTFLIIASSVFLLIVILVITAAQFRIHSARMQASLERAEAASLAKSEFLSRMSHEIRTPMNAIVGLSDLTCMTEGLPEAVHVNLSKIRYSAHYLLSLISDILDMSRIESGKMAIVSEPFSLHMVMEELKAMMTEEANRHDLEFLMETEIRHPALSGDAIRLKQVLTNLISNAFKFTPSGGKVTVCVTETQSDEKEVSFLFRVADSGIGISADDQKRIFEAFEQVGANYTRSQGTGLGLAISNTIVQLMGGELKVKSEPDNGSEFYFTLSFPVDTLAEEPEGESVSYDLSGLSILLAEDNDLNAEIATELLSLQGASVVRAKNGREAAEIFEKSDAGKFQAILMDLQMPVMDGLASCRVIRQMKRPDAAAVPIIAMTANSFKEDADAAMEAGMNGFVAKPVDAQYLFHTLLTLTGGPLKK